MFCLFQNSNYLSNIDYFYFLLNKNKNSRIVLQKVSHCFDILTSSRPMLVSKTKTKKTVPPLVVLNHNLLTIYGTQ